MILSSSDRGLFDNGTNAALFPDNNLNTVALCPIMFVLIWFCLLNIQVRDVDKTEG